MNKLDRALIALCIALMLIGTATMTYLVFKPVAATVQAQTGDLNHDGVVDALDLSILTSHWTKPVDIQQATQSGGLK